MNEEQFDQLKNDIASGITEATLIDAHMQDVRALARYLVNAGWKKS